MNFQLTDDRRMLADSLDRYLREQYPFDARQAAAQSSEGCRQDQWQALAELGAQAALFDESQGGMGGGGFDVAVVFESLGRGLVLEPFVGALMAGQVLATVARDETQTLLAECVAGVRMVVMAHEEADTGADVANVALRAERDGHGWRLTGRKVAVAQARMASHFVVSARTSGRRGDAAGLSLFLVPANTAGLGLEDHALFDGGRSAHLHFDGTPLPASRLLGDVDAAHGVLERAVGFGLLALAAESLGVMEVAKAATLDYLRTRKQFGVPIGSFQALQHRMADLLLEVEQARSAVINAAAAMAAPRIERERALSAAKYTVGRVGTLVAQEAIQMHGGIGMTWELPLAHYAKRLVMIDHQLGDEDQHLVRYSALGRAA